MFLLLNSVLNKIFDFLDEDKYFRLSAVLGLPLLTWSWKSDSDKALNIKRIIMH